MILKKTPLAIAVATAISMSMSASADILITQSGSTVINSEISSGVVVEEQTITGLVDIDIQSSGKVSDAVIINQSNLSQVFIENNGRIFAGEPEEWIKDDKSGLMVPFGNVGLVVADSTVKGVDTPEGNGKVVFVLNDGGSIEASEFSLDESVEEYDAPALAVFRSTVNGSIINTNGGEIEGETGVDILWSEFNGDIKNLSGSKLSVEQISKLFAEGKLEELSDISLVFGKDVAILVDESKFNGNIINTGILLSERESAIEIDITDFSGDIINDGLIIAGNANGIQNNDGSTSYGWSNAILINGQIYPDYPYENINPYKTNLNVFSGNIVNNGELSASSDGVVIKGQDFNGKIINNGLVNTGSSGFSILGGVNGQVKVLLETDEVQVSEEEFNQVLSQITGEIVNNGLITASRGGVSLNAVDFKGIIANSGSITSLYDGITITEGYDESWSDNYNYGLNGNSSGYNKYYIQSVLSVFNGDIINSGSIHAGNDGVYLRGIDFSGSLINTEFIEAGNSGIVIEGGRSFSGEVSWGGESPAGFGESIQVLSTFQGEILNSGNIKAIEGDGISLKSIDFTGSVENTGVIDSRFDGITITGGYGESWSYSNHDSGIYGNFHASETSTVSSVFRGDIKNSGKIDSGYDGIYIADVNFNGSISNFGLIQSGNSGIYIDDSVIGSVIVNHASGSISSPLAIRMNQNTRTNYTGGSIVGDVQNHGGTFYVEGNRVIDGDYSQNKDATLSLGLHTETSLTANNITLDEGSRLLIDVSKGNLYVASGQSVALLVVNNEGGLLLNNVNPEVIGNQLVSIKGFEILDGKLTATFERTSFDQLVSDSKNPTQFNQLDANALTVANTLNTLGLIAQTNPSIRALLESVVDRESINRLLPDNTGASTVSARVASNMSNNQVSVRARGIASGDMVDTTGVWIQAMGANAKQKTRDGIDGYDADSWGLVLGSDVELNSGHVLGAAYSYINNDSDSRLSSSDTDYHMLTGYWGYAHGNLLMDAQVYYGKGNTDASRQALNNTTASASYDSSLYGVRAAAGYQFDLGNETSFVPTLSLEHSRLSVDGYTETGSANNLIVGKQKSDRLELGLTGELSRTYQVNQNLVTPRVTLGAFHDFEADRQSINAAFAVSPSATFTSQGAKPNKTRYVAGVGVDLINANDLTISAEYNYNWESSFRANAGAIKLRWEF